MIMSPNFNPLIILWVIFVCSYNFGCTMNPNYVTKHLTVKILQFLISLPSSPTFVLSLPFSAIHQKCA